MFLIVFQGASGDVLEIISRFASFYLLNIWIVVFPLALVGPRILSFFWVVGMSDVVRVHVLPICRYYCSLCVARFSVHLRGYLWTSLSFHVPRRSDCWAPDGLLTSLCTPALVLLSVFIGRVQTDRTVDIIWAIQSLNDL